MSRSMAGCAAGEADLASSQAESRSARDGEADENSTPAAVDFGTIARMKSADPAPAATLRLSSGRRAEFRRESGEDLLTVSSPDGRVELAIRFTAAGPVLSFESAALSLKSAGEIAVECERFRVDASQALDLRSGGDLRTEAAGETLLRSGGDLRTTAAGETELRSGGDLRAHASGAAELRAEETARLEGRAVEVTSRRGNVDLKANDDVRLRGERVKLNC